MRRVVIVVVLVFAALTVIAIDAGDPLFITVRETELRSAPGFLSKIVSRLSYGDELSYTSSRSGWHEITVVETEETGWIHEGSVRENATSQLAGAEGATRTVSSREIALAGRGFSKELEDGYSSEKGLSFKPVDDLEAFRIDPEVLSEFLAEADLALYGGSQ